MPLLPLLHLPHCTYPAPSATAPTPRYSPDTPSRLRADLSAPHTLVWSCGAQAAAERAGLGQVQAATRTEGRPASRAKRYTLVWSCGAQAAADRAGLGQVDIATMAVGRPASREAAKHTVMPLHCKSVAVRAVSCEYVACSHSQEHSQQREWGPHTHTHTCVC